MPPDATPIPYPNYGAPPYSIPPYGYPPYAPGYAAPPSQPLWPGYAAPPYAPYAPYPFTAPPYAPPLPQRRRRVSPWLVGVAGVVTLVVLVCCALSTVGALQRLSSLPSAALSTVTPTPVATAGATPTLASTLDSVVLYENSFSSGATGWTDDSKCHLGTDGYHVTSSGCTAPVGTESDVDIKTQVKQLSGPPTYGSGIMLRLDLSALKWYGVAVNSVGQWVVYRCAGTNSDGGSKCETIVGPNTNSTIHRGLGVSNTIEVRAKGTNSQVYVNGTQVGTFTDSAYSSGYLGLVTTIGVEAVFSNFSVSLLN